MKITQTLYVTNRAEWRAWLAEHFESDSEIWLIYYKKHTGRPRIPYVDAVEEALCYGWIDSLVQRMDDETYAQKFTPRKNTRKWSALNLGRMRRLIREGRMTAAGLAKIDPALLEAPPPRAPKRRAVPAFMKRALAANPPAWDNFRRLAPSYRRQYIAWLMDAKREATRQKRLREAVRLLKRNEKLGMK